MNESDEKLRSGAYKKLEEQKELDELAEKARKNPDVYPIYLLAFFSVSTFSLLVGILIRWQLEATWYFQGQEFPTLSDLIRLNKDIVMRPLFIVFYSFFTFTAIIFLHASFIDDTHTLDTLDGESPYCCSLPCLNTSYQTFTIIYWMSTVYGIFTLIMLFIFDNETTPDDHIFYAIWGFLSLLLRSWCLYLRRRTRRTSMCYVPGEEKTCQDSALSLLFLALNTTQVVACTVCLVLFPSEDGSKFEWGIVFCLSFDPIFQLVDFWEDRVCTYAIEARERHVLSASSIIKVYKGD